MAKEKTVYICSACGYETPRWMGKCPGCSSWNTLEEQAPSVSAGAAPVKANKQRGGTGAKAMKLEEIPEESASRASTGIGELDRVLGGGLLAGSLTLVVGDPGVGKSSMTIKVCADLAKTEGTILYVTGEESARQVKMRAERLGALADDLYILSETNLDTIEAQTMKLQPRLLVIDSIQTVFRPDIESAPGSISQVRECSVQLLRIAKANSIAVILVGHVLKDGNCRESCFVRNI